MNRIRKHYILSSLLALLIVGVVVVRLYMNTWLKEYVNNVLNHIDGYQGSIADIDVDLYRGAYRIHELKLFKKTGHIPTPFIDIALVDLSIQWGALLHGRVVSDADLTKPVINFAVSPAGTTEQTGAGVDWTKPIKDLMPIDINLVKFREGKLTYQDFSTEPKVNIYINNMSGEARNLRNVVDKDKKLPSTLIVKGDSIGKGDLNVNGRLNILKPFPDMDLNVKLEKVNLPALSNYSNAYAAVDIRSGVLNLYSEVAVRNGHVSGYIKPIANNVGIIDLRKSANPIKLAWETLVALVVEVFTNQPHDQFATKIPLEGELNDVNTNTWSALGGIVRNAFFGAFKKGFDKDVPQKNDKADAK